MSRTRFALAYPNTSYVGLANLGLHAVYGMVRGFGGVTADVFFSDSPRGILYGGSLASCGVIAFSVSFELDYSQIVAMLRDAGLMPLASQRGEDSPLVIIGGVAPSLNPEPLALIADAIFVGEAEGGFDIIDLILRDNSQKSNILKELEKLSHKGWYVPGPQKRPVEYARAPSGFFPAHTTLETSLDDAFNRSYLVEISRGCPHACRFCAAGHLTRPTRFVDAGKIIELTLERNAFSDKVGLVGTAVSDHPDFARIAETLMEGGKKIAVSSFRVENMDAANLEILKRGGLKNLTIALEAGSERLRAVIGKNLSRGEILDAAMLARKAGLTGLKIYAMVGLPTETDDDLAELVALVGEVKKAMGRGTIALSVSPFVPKPQTPFQWEPMESEDSLKKRIRLLQKGVGPIKGVELGFESARWARFQGLLSRGGRELGPMLAGAQSQKDLQNMLKTPYAAGVLAGMPQNGGEPWDFVLGAPKRAHLMLEKAKSLRGERPLPCRGGEKCSICGISACGM